MNIASCMMAASFKESIKAHLKNKSPATKPSCITEDGTLFRIINTIIQNKACYMNVTSKPRMLIVEKIRTPWIWKLVLRRWCEDYNSSNESLDQLSLLRQRYMAGLSLTLPQKILSALQLFNSIISTSCQTWTHHHCHLHCHYHCLRHCCHCHRCRHHCPHLQTFLGVCTLVDFCVFFLVLAAS